MAIWACAEAIQVYEDSNRSAELSLAMFAIVTLSPNVVSLQQEGIQEINDMASYFKTATQESAIDASDPHAPSKPYDPNDPGAYATSGNGAPMTAVAAFFNEQKTIAQNQSDIDNKKLSTLLQATQSNATMLGNSLSNILQFAQPLLELLNQIRSIVAGI